MELLVYNVAFVYLHLFQFCHVSLVKYCEPYLCSCLPCPTCNPQWSTLLASLVPKWLMVVEGTNLLWKGIPLQKSSKKVDVPLCRLQRRRDSKYCRNVTCDHHISSLVCVKHFPSIFRLLEKKLVKQTIFHACCRKYDICAEMHHILLLSDVWLSWHQFELGASFVKICSLSNYMGSKVR